MTTILVIEDEQPIRDTLQDVLELEGFDVLSAVNGLVGVQLAKQFYPDLIVCDIMMPELDGYGVLEALRQDTGTAGIPFIFLSAKADRSSLRQGMNLGADDYLTKPFTPQELLEALSSRLNKQAILIQPLTHQISDLTARLDYQTYHDPLTHLPNRLSLQQPFEALQASANPNNDLIPLLHLNLYQLSRISTALGQTFSNHLLELICTRLTTLDCINRIASINNHQLALLINPLATLQEVEWVIQNVLDQFSLPFLLNQHELFLAPQIGVACYPKDGESLNTLLSHAEMAIAGIGSQSGADVCFYSPHQQVHAATHLELEADLRHALERNQFQVYYQPQIDLKTDRLLGAEALLRWVHPERGNISPATFIPIAEETGLIVPIGEWVLRTACAQMKIWQAQNPDLHISVNLSPRQFTHPHFLQSILNSLADTGLSPGQLELEITESILMQDTQLALQLLNTLKQQGIQTAIDDFGVGYSSFSYLQQFPLDTLKIDRCFVRNLGENPRNSKIIAAIIQMSHDMNLRVVAEGIEQESELRLLRQLQCDIAQGYWFSPPLAKEAFEQKFIAADRLRKLPV